MMKVFIGNNGEGQIITKFDTDNPESRGEIAHFIAELELIKQGLLVLWDEFEGKE